MYRPILTIKQRFVDYYRCHIKPFFAKDFHILLGIVLLALILRLYFALTVSVDADLRLWVDYILVSEGGPVDGLRGPLYIYFLRFIFSFGGPILVSVFQAVSGVFCVILLYFIATRIGNRRAGLLAAGIGAVYPGWILQVISATPATLLVLVSIVLMAALLSRGSERFRAIVSAAAVAMGILLEPVMVFLVPGTFIAVRKRTIFAIVLVGFLLPWTLRNSIIERRPVPVYRVEAYKVDFDRFLPGNLPGRKNFVESLYYNASKITSKGWVAVRAEKEESNRNNVNTVAYAYTVIMIFGMFGIVKRYKKTHRAAVLPFASYTLLLIILTVFNERYRIVLEPVFIAYAAVLIFDFRETGKSKHEPTVVRGLNLEKP